MSMFPLAPKFRKHKLLFYRLDLNGPYAVSTLFTKNENSGEKMVTRLTPSKKGRFNKSVLVAL